MPEVSKPAFWLPSPQELQGLRAAWGGWGHTQCFAAPAAPDADMVGLAPFPFGGSALSRVHTTSCSKQAPGTRGIQRISDKCRR